MLRQYHAQRRLGGFNPLGVGTIPLHSIFYLQDDDYWRARYGRTANCRTPWIVIAFLNGQMGAARRNQETGQWESIYMGNRTDTALVRSLRDNRTQVVSIHSLQIHEEEGLRRDDMTYPTRPELRYYRRGALLSPADAALAIKAAAPRNRRPAALPTIMAQAA